MCNIFNGPQLPTRGSPPNWKETLTVIKENLRPSPAEPSSVIGYGEVFVASMPWFHGGIVLYKVMMMINNLHWRHGNITCVLHARQSSVWELQSCCDTLASAELTPLMPPCVCVYRAYADLWLTTPSTVVTGWDQGDAWTSSPNMNALQGSLNAHTA